MKIVHAVRSDGFAGVERHVAGLARAQAAAGHQVCVIGGDPRSMARAVDNQGVVLRSAATVPQVVSALRRMAPGSDVVHVHMTAAEVAATVAASTLRRFPPVVSTRHFAGVRGRGRLGTVSAAVARRGVDAQIAVSDYVAAHIDGPSVVIPPGAEAGPVREAGLSRERTVLMVQRLEPEKRSDLGLRAFAASGLVGQGWTLSVVGDGSQRSALGELASELGIGGAVEFLGVRDDVADLMSAGSLLLAPCEVEGLGLSVVEAMAAGLPVVAAGAGGHLETLADLDELALYPPGDPEAAGRNLVALAADQARRDRLAEAARARHGDRYSPAAQVAATDAVYENVREKTKLAGPAAAGEESLVVLSLEAWDEVWRRNQYLVAELLRSNPNLRVLFVEPAADPLHQLSRRARPRRGRGLRVADSVKGVAPGRLLLFQPTKICPRKLDRRVDERLASQVLRAALDAGLRRPVLWVNDPAGATVVQSVGWPPLYDITDDWLAAQRTPDEHGRLVRDEGLLLRECSEVTVCSPYLEKSKSATGLVSLITNGVDVDRYRRPHPVPADLPTGTVALYLGTVHPDRFDVPLLLDTATHLGDGATVVVVGPIVDVPEDQRAALTEAGVRLLGARPWEAVPAYLQHADVLLVPHLVNAFTDSLDPIKLYEYRAVGRPVVSTPVAGFRDATDPRVICVAGKDFPEAVRQALATGDGTLGELPTDIPTWERQAARMADVIGRVRRSAAGRP